MEVPIKRPIGLAMKCTELDSNAREVRFEISAYGTWIFAYTYNDEEDIVETRFHIEEMDKERNELKAVDFRDGRERARLHMYTFRTKWVKKQVIDIYNVKEDREITYGRCQILKDKVTAY